MTKERPSILDNHYIYLVFDFIFVFIVSLVSFFCLYGINGFGDYVVPVLIYSGSAALVTVIAFILFKIHKIVVTEIGLFESLRIMLIVFIIQLAGLFVVVFTPAFDLGWSYFWVWFLSTTALIFFIITIRSMARVIRVSSTIATKGDRVRTLIVGAGSVGKVVVDETRRNNKNHNKVIAFVDDDPNKIGGSLANIPIKGPISEISKIIDYYQIEEVIIAMSRISDEDLHRVLDILSTCSVRVRRMPLISEMEGPNDRRIIDVDLNDLLNREPIKLDNHEVYDVLNGKTVLVTGAGGTIGSELVRQIFKTRPKTLVLFDIYENGLYDIQMELNRRMRDKNITDVEVVALIGSTYNEFRVETIIKQYKPDYIYHAAAYKHVPLMEDSPAEAIRTNVVGTYNVAKMADKYAVKKMVLVSTDKAVRPTNVMGATKRFAETIIQYFAEKSKVTKYAAVRFGNVLGSNGSVVPLFKKQIETGGPVTLTDKRIIRYFMTIPEAVSLILQCGLFAEGGEIFILDMGKPVRILDLAEKLIRQAGMVPYVDIDIVETGLRPGEKLYEELLLDVKHQRKTKNKKIYIEEREDVNKHIKEDIEMASKAFEMEKTSDVKGLLAQLISTYTITENKND